MCIPWVSSVPTGLIVADFSVHASVPCFAWRTPLQTQRTKEKKGGTKTKVAHKWARWLQNPCHLGGPHRFRAGGRIRGGPQVNKVAT